MMTASRCDLLTIKSGSKLQKPPTETQVATAKGKGKVKPRKSQPGQDVVHAAVPRLLDSENVKNGECKSYSSPRFAAYLRHAWVKTVQLRPVGGFQQAHLFMQSGTPLKLKGSPLIHTTSAELTMQKLVSLMRQEQHSWKILCSDCKRNAFVDCKDSNNIFGSYYHVREPETQQLQMNFNEYAECAANWTAKNILFDNTIMQQQPGQAPNTEPQKHPGIPLEFKQHLHNSIDWAWLEETQQLARLGRVQSVRLQSTSHNALLPAQYKTHDRLITQVTGAQRLLLISPGYAFKGMYPFPVHHPYDGYIMADLEDPNPAQWPGIENVRGICCILQPNDIAFVPAYWFVHTQFLEGSNISLSFNMSGGRRMRAPECIPLQLSRHLERRVADAEGVADVRHWLQLLGYEEEEKWIDLATVQGYRRIVMCQGIRDEVQLQLEGMASDSGPDTDQGGQQWKEVLLAMCSRRLLPTEWLNKDYREPLYLTDIPRRYEDTRTEEERKYPQLFSHRQQAGWTETKPKQLTYKSTEALSEPVPKTICQ